VVKRLIAGLACGLFFPVLLMVALFAIANTLGIGNDAGAALIMAGFFYGVPLACVLGFAFGVAMGER
jgi:predicted MFS family arabinose efflux permease